MPVAARAIAAGSLVLLCQGLRRQPDRADGSRLHVPRAAVAGTAGGLVVQTEDVPAVLRELVGCPSRHYPASARAISFSTALISFWPSSVLAQSDSKTSRIAFTTFASFESRPTSRRPSSSSARRL